MSTTPSSQAGMAPGRALQVPLLFAGALAAWAFVIEPIRVDPHLFPILLGAAGFLVVWAGALFVRARSQGRRLSLDVAIYKHHWVQGLTQTGILLYWGWFVRPVYNYIPLIVAQLFFAWGVDCLLQWSRRDDYKLGFGPTPIILSINLFIWFRPDWYYFQFAMILVGYLGKELIRWQRTGRSRHIFNPSSLPLSITSLFLIVFGATDLTLGQFIAQTQFNPPHMYLFIFLISVPVQLLFGVARVTMAAVLTVFAISVGYFQVTGTFLFPDAWISLPVFLGMHLIITDPSTSPRSDLGQMAFGVMYGLGVVGIYLILVAIGAPPFYDKLLPVPLLNLMVRLVERAVASEPLRRINPSRLWEAASTPRRYLAYTGLWAAIFVGLTSFGGFSDDHPGQYPPFWQEACAEGSDRACDYVFTMMASYCERESGWSCNELGAYLLSFDRERRAQQAFARACALGFEPGCANRNDPPADAGSVARGLPTLADLPVVLRGSKGPVEERDPEVLYAMACEQGWDQFCGGGPPGATATANEPGS